MTPARSLEHDPGKKTELEIEGAPDLVVEFPSPSTAGKDLTRKRWTYEAAGVREYLIVDPDERLGVLLGLDGGIYGEPPASKGAPWWPCWVAS